MPGDAWRADAEPVADHAAAPGGAMPTRRHPLFTAALAGLIAFTSLIVLNVVLQGWS